MGKAKRAHRARLWWARFALPTLRRRFHTTGIRSKETARTSGRIFLSHKYVRRQVKSFEDVRRSRLLTWSNQSGGYSAMKFTRSFVGGTAAALMFVLASAVQAQPVSLRIAGAFGGEHTSSKAMEIFKTQLARRSQ